MKSFKPVLTVVLLFVVAAVSILSACSKDDTVSWIVGKWTRVNVVNMDSVNINYNETWEFTEDGILRVSYVVTGGWIFNYDGSYSVDSYKTFTIDVPDSHEFALLNGKWQIVRREDNYMMAIIDMTQFDGAGGGLTFREFRR
jgi:hypothetical protein